MERYSSRNVRYMFRLSVVLRIFSLFLVWTLVFLDTLRCVALNVSVFFFNKRDAVSISQCFLVHFFIFPDIFVFEFTVFYGKYFESDIGAEWTGIPPCGTVKDPTNGVTRKPFPPLRSSSALLDPHEERDGVLPFPTGFATLVPFEHECLSE